MGGNGFSSKMVPCLCDTIICHRGLLVFAVSYAKARQAKADETAQPEAELVLVVVWFLPSKRDVLLSLLLPHRDASQICGSLCSTQGSQLLEQYMKVLIISLLLFFIWTLKALYPNNPAGDGTMDFQGPGTISTPGSKT